MNGEVIGAGDFFSDSRFLGPFLMLWFDVVLFGFVIFVIDTKFIKRLTGPKLDSSVEVGIDADQKLLLQKLPPVVGTTMAQKDENIVHAQTLSKRYPLAGGGAVQAVRETSVGVKPDTVLGLLGPNGAGKTTMMSMMSGIEGIDSGEAWINSSSVNTELSEARKLLGLCPQFDALMGNLTAREHLHIFAKIRGVPGSVRTQLVDRTLRDMDLDLKADAKAKSYSGGNKRKLSVAMSMIANPTVNFLDEVKHPQSAMSRDTSNKHYQSIECRGVMHNISWVFSAVDGDGS